MLYNQHLEPISTEVIVGTPCLSTPPYTPHDLQSSIKSLISTPLLAPPGRAQNRPRSYSPATIWNALPQTAIDAKSIDKFKSQLNIYLNNIIRGLAIISFLLLPHSSAEQKSGIR